MYGRAESLAKVDTATSAAVAIRVACPEPLLSAVTIADHFVLKMVKDPPMRLMRLLLDSVPQPWRITVPDSQPEVWLNVRLGLERLLGARAKQAQDKFWHELIIDSVIRRGDSLFGRLTWRDHFTGCGEQTTTAYATRYVSHITTRGWTEFEGLSATRTGPLPCAAAFSRQARTLEAQTKDLETQPISAVLGWVLEWNSRRVITGITALTIYPLRLSLPPGTPPAIDQGLRRFLNATPVTPQHRAYQTLILDPIQIAGDSAYTTVTRQTVSLCPLLGGGLPGTKETAEPMAIVMVRREGTWAVQPLTGPSTLRSVRDCR
jgi:hypothetical protein